MLRIDYAATEPLRRGKATSGTIAYGRVHPNPKVRPGDVIPWEDPRAFVWALDGRGERAAYYVVYIVTKMARGGRYHLRYFSETGQPLPFITRENKRRYDQFFTLSESY